jgi:probable rRNA maturation factor
MKEPSMSEPSPVQVELNVQDLFFEVQPEENAQLLKSESVSPISVETWETWFCRWLEYLNPNFSANYSYEISIRLTDDAEVQALNAQYRQKNQPTDVLAFASLEVDCPHPQEMQDLPLYLGDIVISVETARVQADQQKHALKQELAWLAAHALLHLLGWDHPDEASLAHMLAQQNVLLQQIGLAPVPVL